MRELESLKSDRLSLERRKIYETIRLDNFKQTLKEASLFRADEIVEKRMEASSVSDVHENSKINEFLYALEWGKIEKPHEIQTDVKAINPHYSEGKQWKVNCQRCVPALEMRKRGYDVTATPKPLDVDPTDLCYRPFDVWSNPSVLDCTGSGKEEIESKMAEWGDGSRAQVVLVWKHTNSGHTFFAERKGGKTRFYDPQTGGMNVEEYFRRAEPGKTQFCRIDRLDVTNRIKECCQKV